MGDGLYAARMGGGSVDPATGEFNFAVQEGYLVKGGKITHARARREPDWQGRGYSDEDRPRGARYAHGAGHVRKPQRQRAHQRGPADDSRIVHHGGRARVREDEAECRILLSS